MRFLIDDLPVCEQIRINKQNAREMQKFINDNPIMSGTVMNGVEYRSRDIKESDQQSTTPPAQQ